MDIDRILMLMEGFVVPVYEDVNRKSSSEDIFNFTSCMLVIST